MGFLQRERRRDRIRTGVIWSIVLLGLFALVFLILMLGDSVGSKIFVR